MAVRFKLETDLYTERFVSVTPDADVRMSQLWEDESGKNPYAHNPATAALRALKKVRYETVWSPEYLGAFEDRSEPAASNCENNDAGVQ